MRGVVLLGGESSRMGQPKQWLLVGEQPVLLHTLEMMHTVCSDVVVVVRDVSQGERVRPLGVRVVTDEFPGQGPLAGLHAGLRGVDPDGAVCLVGCDLPFMHRIVLEDLHKELVADPHVQAVVPRDEEGRLYPVCAVYRGDVREQAADCLRGQENAMRPFLARLSTKYVPVGKWQHLLPSPFLNMNTPADYELACRLHKERSE